MCVPISSAAAADAEPVDESERCTLRAGGAEGSAVDEAPEAAAVVAVNASTATGDKGADGRTAASMARIQRARTRLECAHKSCANVKKKQCTEAKRMSDDSTH